MSHLPDDDGETRIFEAVNLPCGRVAPNRLVKVAMYEHLADFSGGPPNSSIYHLYALWARGGWGMVFTGNVQVDRGHLTLGRDMVAPLDLSEEFIRPFKQLASIIHDSGDEVTPSLAIMQLSHGGRQSANGVGGRWPWLPPTAPSAVVVGSNGKENRLGRFLYRAMFTAPKAMDKLDIDRVVDAFVQGARLAQFSGFDGIELHASHGYLLSSFLSSKTNKRNDEYSCDTPENALRIIHRILASIRTTLPATFIVGIKLNAADYVSGGSDAEERAIGHLRYLASWNAIDFLEISGGDYESPDFMAASSPRQAFFSRYAAKAMQVLSEVHLEGKNVVLPLVLLTGGLRTAASMQNALRRRHAHFLGIGRPSVIRPDLPRLLKDMDDTMTSKSLVVEPDLGMSIWGSASMPKLVGAGAGMAWYVVQMRRLAHGQGVKPDLGATSAVLRMWIDESTLHALCVLGTVVVALTVYLAHSSII